MRTSARRRPDVFGAPVFAWMRVVVAVGVVAGGVLIGPTADDTRTFFLLSTFAGLPAAIILLLALGRIGMRTHAILSAAFDLVASICLHVLIDDGAQVARLAYVAIPAVATISTGFVPAFVITVAGNSANAVIDFADAGTDDFNPWVHAARLGLASLLVLVVARATDERRKAQASERAASTKAETILSRVASPVVVTDATGNLLEWNDAATAVMTPVENLPAGEMTCNALLNLHAGSRPLDCSNGCGLLRLRHQYEGNDLPDVFRLLPGGRRQPLIADAAAVVDSDGAVVEVVHSLHDVTRLMQADEAKTLFLATASHELKTPLTVISGFAELLLSMPDLPESEKREGLETIRRRAAELASIVDRLLLSSRIESGRVQVNVESIDLVPLVRERVEALARVTGRQVSLTSVESVPQADADPSAFTTIVDHLLENAIRYSPGGEPVDAVVRVVHDSVEVSIQDRGIGMDRHQQQRCFERFWQAESTDVRRFGGTGIGLYIVKSLVEAMSGSISVTSQLGRGTTFTLRLPRSVQVDLSAAPSSDIGEIISQTDVAAKGGNS